MLGKEKIRDDYFNDNSNGENHDNEHKKIKKRKKKSFKGFILKLLIFIVALFVFVLALSWMFTLFLPQKTSFLIMATDQDGTRTDTIMIGSFDKTDKKFSLVSIPRDTYITVSEETRTIMREDFPKPGGRSMKINAVHHYGGEKHGTKLVIDEVERLTGVEIDYYVKVDFEAFRYIIDSVGGVDFYVPRDMNYSDPLQDLHINLREGWQHLDGKGAEQVLRYRSGYATADIGRIEVQQDFVREFVLQAFSKKNLLTHPGAFLNAFFKYGYVETNAGIFDALPYAMLLGGINDESIETQTLPGTTAMRGGQSVYLIKEAEANEVFSSFSQ